MTYEGLTIEDREHLYRLCVIPFIITLCIFIFYLVFLMRNQMIKTTMDLLTKLFLPFVIIVIMVGVISFETLYHRKVKKPLMFHMKRLVWQFLFVLACAISFFALLLLFDTYFSQILGKWNAVLALLLWTVVFAVMVTRYQRYFRGF